MKKKYVVISIVGIVVAVMALIGIWMFPLLRVAATLHSALHAESYDYQVAVTLNEQILSEQQRQFLSLMPWVLGIEEEDCLEWSVEGKISEGCGYAKLYGGGLHEPITDVYFKDDQIMVNVKMLYQSLQKNIAEEHAMLGSFLPEWEYGDYISLAQIEKIFEVNIEEIFQDSNAVQLSRQSFWEIWNMLRRMERKEDKDGRQRFETTFNHYQTMFEIGRKEKVPMLAVLGKDVEGKQPIAGFQASLLGQGPEKIIFPKSIMKEEEVAKLQELWSTLRKAQGTLEGLW